MQNDVTVMQDCFCHKIDPTQGPCQVCARHRKSALADAQVEPVAAQDVAALVEENKRLQQALVDHNDRLRSAHSVAFRDGAETNWQTFRGAVTYTLAEHHETVVAARTALAKHERTPHD